MSKSSKISAAPCIAGAARSTRRPSYVVRAIVADDGEVVAEIRIDGNDGRGSRGTRGRGDILIRVEVIEDYCADEDPVGEFLKAKCKLTADDLDPSTGRRYEASAKRMRDAYVAWCKDEGLDPLACKTFGSKLTGRGIERRKTGGLTVYVGVLLCDKQ